MADRDALNRAGLAAGPSIAVVEAVDDARARVRRPVDVVRLVGLVLTVVLIAVLGTVADGTVRSADGDLARGLGHLPSLFVHALSVLGAVGALALPLAFIIREISRAQPRRLIEGVVTGGIAIAVVTVLNRAITADPGSALHSALIEAAKGTTARPLDTYLAAIFAFMLVLGVAGEPIWRTTFWLVVAVYVVSALTARQASVLTVVASPAIGALVGVAVRYLAGSANERPDARRIAAELRNRRLDVVRIERVHGTGERARSYLATTGAGERLNVQAFDRDLIASGAAYDIYRRLRLRATVATPPALSLERVAERRTLLALAAMAADVHIPRFVAGVPCGSETIILVYEQVAGTSLRQPTDLQLDDLWDNVAKLHRVQVTHCGLTADSIMLAPDGRVILPIPTDGTTFASELRISLDRAQALITTAQLAGAERAVQVARTQLSDTELAATIPLLQPIALPGETRAALKKDTTLLASVLDEIHAQTHRAPPEPIRVERFRPRAVVSIVAAIVAGYLIVGQLGSVDLGSVLSDAKWEWIPFVLLASGASYFAAALSLIGYVREPLSFARTFLVQIASSFAGFIAPPSVAGLAINIRYLRLAKLSPAAAATSVGMSQAINAITHAVLLVILVAATGASSKQSLPIPGWAFGAVGALAVLTLLLLALPGLRRWAFAHILPPLREVVPRLLSLLSSPTKLAEALAGTLLLNICYIAALVCSVQAFGGRVSIAGVAVVYLAGAALASAAPTPGGLGAVEVALSTGLAAMSMPSAAAVSAVLLFRLATFWLPVPIGWAALNHLQRQGAI